MKHIVYLLAVIIICLSSRTPQTIKKWYLSGYAQGTTYHITYHATDSIFTQSQVDSILNSLDSSLSLYKPYSVVNAFNNSQTGIKVDTHLRNVVRKGMEVYDSSEGTFDITVWPLVTAWGFGVQKVTEVPDSAAIARLLPCIGTDKLQWSGDLLKKQLPCVQLDVNGIAQGYSVDVLATFAESKGITDYLVELGGELRVKGGAVPGHPVWAIGIKAPFPGQSEFPLLIKDIIVTNSAISTSGTYIKFYETAGKRISHLTDPRTGGTIRNEMISVTVRASDAMTADAYDNALMVLGVEKGIRLAKRVGIEAFFVYSKPNGDFADTATAGFYYRE